jgi:hypothetical protein
MSMTAKEASVARERLGLSIEDLSADLALTPDVVQSWETGTVRVPARVARELQWRLAVKARHEALAGSGLPECAWMVAWDEEQFPEGMKAQTAHMERAAEHLTSCSVCKAREQFVVERFGEMPKPDVRVDGWTRLGCRQSKLLNGDARACGLVWPLADTRCFGSLRSCRDSPRTAAGSRR